MAAKPYPYCIDSGTYATHAPSLVLNTCTQCMYITFLEVSGQQHTGAPVQKQSCIPVGICAKYKNCLGALQADEHIIPILTLILHVLV